MSEENKTLKLKDEELEKASGGVENNNGPKFAKGKAYFDGEMCFTVVDFKFHDGTWLYTLEHWDNSAYYNKPLVINLTEAQLDS